LLYEKFKVLIKAWRQALNKLIELRFYVQLDTKQVISEMFLKPISWLGIEKHNLTQQKHAFTNQKKCTTNKHKKN